MEECWGAAIYCGVRRKSFMQMADTASMGIVIAQIIGRWGDFFNRESFGEYTNSIFAMQLPLSAVRSSEVTSAMRENLETIGGTSYIQVHPVFLYESLWCLLLFLLMLVWEAQKTFPRRSISEISGRIWSRTILHRTSSNRQAYDSGNFCWNFPADLSSNVCNLCYDRSCGRNHGEKRGRQGADAGENRTMKRRKEQPEKLKQKSTETGSDWRELLQMEMPQVFREVYNGTASAYEHDSEESEETSSVEEEHPEENPRDEENTEKIVEEENSVAEDFYEEDSEKDTEEVSEEEAFPEASSTEKSCGRKCRDF